MQPSKSTKSFYVGVDEAGRGPVLGPMVYAAFSVPVDDYQRLLSMNPRDSKLLTPSKREALFDRLSLYTYEYKIVSPDEITTAMFSKTDNLNKLAHRTIESVVTRLLPPESVDTLYVDAVGPTPALERLLRSKGYNALVRCKADSLFPVVSAASIVAKVVRDRSLASWPLDSHFSRDYGSGYPADPITVEWLRKTAVEVKRTSIYPDIIRYGWATARRLFAKAPIYDNDRKKKTVTRSKQTVLF